MFEVRVKTYMQSGSADHVFQGFNKKLIGGEGGIRTHEGLAPLPVFKTGTINHSVTSPSVAAHYITVIPPI